MSRDDLRRQLVLMKQWQEKSVDFVMQYDDVIQNREVQRYQIKYERALRDPKTLRLSLCLYKAAQQHKSYTLGHLARCMSGHKNDAIHSAAQGRIRKILTMLHDYQLITHEEVSVSKRSIRYKITATKRLQSLLRHCLNEASKTD